MSHLEDHNILVDYQHSFRQNQSCETQTIEHLAQSIDHQYQTSLLKSVFSKAFDTVTHKWLPLKLYHCGIWGQALAWIGKWQVNQTPQVASEGVLSEISVVKSGVPQGTVLVPLCILLYINDMDNDISSQLKLFAGNSLLYSVIHNALDLLTVQHDLEKLMSWAKIWQM